MPLKILKLLEKRLAQYRARLARLKQRKNISDRDISKLEKNIEAVQKSWKVCETSSDMFYEMLPAGIAPTMSEVIKSDNPLKGFITNERDLEIEGELEKSFTVALTFHDEPSSAATDDDLHSVD